MCGIAGVVTYSHTNPKINGHILDTMSESIIHRGPDSGGAWVSPSRKCGLAFRRLAIIDLSEAGNQPMSSPDGRYSIVFNGEIYNHAEIRKDLDNRGYKYRSKTDTETILYGFMEFGPSILEKMHGMWAFAIWDEEKQELFLSRDRIGIKPLYFTERNGYFVFSSEIKAILRHPEIAAEFNEYELPNYLNFGMSSNRESLFKDIHKIPAGHFVSLKKGSAPELKRYWSPIKQNQEYLNISREEAREEIMRLLRQAIKDRMMSDVPFGVFLSGGIDSTLNVALMAELMDRPVDTYTVGFKELEKYNELKYARIAAEKWETNHREILIDEKSSFPILEDLAWHEDEPNADPVCIPLYFLSKLTRDSGTIVIQVGEGSDEQFVGYPWMMREYNFFRTYWKFFNSLPGPAKSLTYNALKPLLKGAKQYQILEYFRRGAKGEQLYWGGSSIFSPTHFEGLFQKEKHNLNSIPAEYAEKLHREILDTNPKSDYLQRIMYVELSQRLAEILLMRADKIGMAHSIEARVPFLDHRIVEFTMSLPPGIKSPDNKTTKSLLKSAVEGLLPDEIIYRKKQGFWAPVNEWLRGDWHNFAKAAILNCELFKEKGIFNIDYIKRLFEIHKSGSKNYGLQLFTLLMLALWHKRFFSK